MTMSANPVQSRGAQTGASDRSEEAGEPKQTAPRVRKRSVWREYLEAFGMAAVLAFGIRTFVIQGYRIPSPSMEQTLLVGDWLFVSKFLYGAEIPLSGGKRLPAVRQPKRGDIIVFRYPRNPKEDYIKRCVAVAGDTVLYRDKVLYINGTRQVEPYARYADGDRMMPGRDNYGPVVVPAGHLFMMGDNRDRSSDSRFWGFLDKRLIRGKALFIYFSWDNERKTIRFGRIFDGIH